MADALTPIYEFTNPEVGASSGTWGGKENTDRTLVDTALSRPRIQRATIVVAGTTPIDVSVATVAKFTVGQITTVTLTGWVADTTPGKWAQRVLCQITNGGAFAVTWPVAIVWLSGVAPTMAAAGVDVVELFSVDNGVTVYGVHHGKLDVGSVLETMLATAVQTKLNSYPFLGVRGYGSTTGPVIATSLTGAVGITIPAARLHATTNKARIRAQGFCNTGGTPVTVTFGGTTVATVTPTSATKYWTIDVDVYYRSVGNQDCLAHMTSDNGGGAIMAVTQSLVQTTKDATATIVVDVLGNPQGGALIEMYGMSVEVLGV